MKERVEGSILVGGSDSLVHELAHRGLVDEYRLVVYPVILGAGKRVFGDGTHTKLELTYEQRTSSGAVLLAYRVQSEQ